MSSTTSLTAASLIDRVKSSDAGAWEELVQLYAPLLANWCARKGVPQRQVPDIVQEVFLAIFKGIRRFENPKRIEGKFRSWLWVVTRSRLANWFEKNQQLVVGGSSHQQWIDNLATFDESNASEHSSLSQSLWLEHNSQEPTVNLDLQSLMRRAMRQVKPQVKPETWLAFYRCVVDGIPTDLVAKETGMSSASVRQARSRVLRRLRQQMGDID